MPADFLNELEKRQLVFDGATGTMLQKLGLKPGGCPDELSLGDPEMVKKVHRAYIEAGSDVVTTNTFGANSIKLKEYGLEGRLRDINIAAARCARAAAGDRFVAGGLGPTGGFMEPVGGMDFDAALDVFTAQATALKDGGADLIIIETMMDIKEMKAAIIGARSTGLPVVATMTFDETMRSVLGTPPESFAIMAEALGADVIGANCSLGIEGIYKAVLAMSRVCSIPLIAQPNAGIPFLKEGRTVFPASPAQMASFVPKLVEAGVRVIGGCCGTSPEHIVEMGRVLRSLPPAPLKRPAAFSSLSCRTSFTLFGGGLPAVIIGERINPTGRKALAQEIKEGKTSGIRGEAREQAASGAHALDVNVGVPGIDEAKAMKMAVFAVNENCGLPVVIDSPNTGALIAGLKAADGKPLINSISGEEKKLSSILPLAKKYGGALLGLTLDDSGIPDTAQGRLKVAEKIVSSAINAGIRKEDIVIDCLAMTVSADPKGALDTIEAIRLVKKHLGVSTVLGVSNISFGLPARELINSNFLTMAMAAGLDCAIINPKNRAMMDAYHSSLVLLNRDLRAERYIKRHQAAAPGDTPATGIPLSGTATGVLTTGEITLQDRLKKAIVEGDEDNITGLVEEALKEGWDPIKISNDGLIPGLEEVGRLFAGNRYYLPQVMLSADTMKKAFTRIKQELKGARGGPSAGKVLLATVEGDIHDIGKNIVATLLENHGFEVLDLGKNVSAKKIIDEAVRNNVDIVGLSALMTTTVMEMDMVIKQLKEKGIKAMTIVGGAVVTKEFADKIGADEYGGDALSAIEKMKRMIKAGA